MSSNGSNPLFATVGEARNNMRDLRTIHEEVRESRDSSRESHGRERPLLRSTTSTGSTGSGTGSIGGGQTSAHAPLMHSSRGSRGSREDSRELLLHSFLDVAAPAVGHVIASHNQQTFRLVTNGELFGRCPVL